MYSVLPIDFKTGYIGTYNSGLYKYEIKKAEVEYKIKKETLVGHKLLNIKEKMNNSLCNSRELSPTREGKVRIKEPLEHIKLPHLLRKDQKEFQIMKKSERILTLKKISNLGSMIFDIEIDKNGNLYYASYENKKVYRISGATGQERAMLNIDYINPDYTLGNILLLNKEADMLYILKNQELVYCFKIPSIADNDDEYLPMTPITTMRVKGTIVEFATVMNRLIVFTLKGKIKLFYGDVKKEANTVSILKEKSRTIDLEIGKNERVVSACVSFDEHFICVATQKSDDLGYYYNRIRFYSLITMRKLKYICLFEERPSRSK